jgi:hypothetical protein
MLVKRAGLSSRKRTQSLAGSVFNSSFPRPKIPPLLFLKKLNNDTPHCIGSFRATWMDVKVEAPNI